MTSISFPTHSPVAEIDSGASHGDVAKTAVNAEVEGAGQATGNSSAAVPINDLILPGPTRSGGILPGLAVPSISGDISALLILVQAVLDERGDENLKQSVNAQLAKLSGLYAEVLERQGDAKELGDRRAGKQATLEDKQADRVSLQERIGQLEAQKSALNGQLAGLYGELAVLDAWLNPLNFLHPDYASKLAERTVLLDKISKVTLDLSRVQAQIEGAYQDLARTNGEIHDVQGEIDALSLSINKIGLETSELLVYILLYVQRDFDKFIEEDRLRDALSEKGYENLIAEIAAKAIAFIRNIEEESRHKDELKDFVKALSEDSRAVLMAFGLRSALSQVDQELRSLRPEEGLAATAPEQVRLGV